MKKNNIFKLLLNDSNVNNYTKVLLVLYQLAYYHDYYIPGIKLSNRTNINIRYIRQTLNLLKEKNIIKLYYKNKKRFFKFVDNELKEDYKIYNLDDIDYNWLDDN